MTLEHKEWRVVLVDTKNYVIKTSIVYRGNLNAADAHDGELFKETIRANAAALIMAHDHPSTDVSPSPADVRVTSNVVNAGRLLDITVLDHIIIGGLDWHSIREDNPGIWNNSNVDDV